MDTRVIYFVYIIILIFKSSEINCKFYADNGLEQTVAYNFLSGRQKNQITQEILNVLQIDHRPKRKVHERDSSAPKFLYGMYQSLWDEETGDVKAPVTDHVVIDGQKLPTKSLRSFFQSDKIISFPNQVINSHRHLKDNRFKFDVTKLSTDDMLLDGQLWLYRDENLNIAARNETYTVTVYSIHKEPGQKKKLTLLSSKQLTDDHWAWLSFNVTSALEEWTHKSHQRSQHEGHQWNHGLLIKVSSLATGIEMETNQIGIVGHRGRKDRQAFLIGFFKSSDELVRSTSSKRTRRAVDSRRRTDVSFYDDDESWNPYTSHSDRYTSSIRSCQKKTLYVSFKDLGWQDWIIAPDGYAAFFCHGECSFPLSPHMNATNHAIVRTLYSLIHNEIPKPCCAPTKLSPIEVLYYDDNSNVVLKKYKNMVVSSCGCH